MFGQICTIDILSLQNRRIKFVFCDQRPNMKRKYIQSHAPKAEILGIEGQFFDILKLPRDF